VGWGLGVIRLKSKKGWWSKEGFGAFGPITQVKGLVFETWTNKIIAILTPPSSYPKSRPLRVLRLTKGIMGNGSHVVQNFENVHNERSYTNAKF
jgi:hypothetical protein